MEIAETIQPVRASVKAARDKGKKIGLVPTMGALHSGHLSLIEAAKQQTDFVVVSIFVNPSQFGPDEDFENYPRDLKTDADACRKAGVDVIFVPTVQEMYPRENLTWVNVEKLTESLCGRSRPGHFRGVTTICAKLFNIIMPDVAFFGQKDAQQAIVIKRMVTDLNMPLEIVVCPTAREESGLAISSRNQYLTETEKKDSAVLYAALQKCKEMVEEGVTDSQALITEMRRMIEQVQSAKIDYVSIVDAETLQEVACAEGKILVALAVHIGRARLIDNILVDLSK
jgi:pantoate--beta-alanine ligase